MAQNSENNFYDYDFFEDIDSINSNRLESLDFDLEQESSIGLSQENVHKLTEDLQNPLPPSDSQG